MRMERMNEKERAGIEKKSFELNYHGGSIWCEHLDGMGEMEEEVIGKFREDRRVFGRPSVSSYMIVNLDETAVTERIAAQIVDGILQCPKRFLMIAFVGVGRKERKLFDRIRAESCAVMQFFRDYEKAKECLLMR